MNAGNGRLPVRALGAKLRVERARASRALRESGCRVEALEQSLSEKQGVLDALLSLSKRTSNAGGSLPGDGPEIRLDLLRRSLAHRSSCARLGDAARAALIAERLALVRQQRLHRELFAHLRQTRRREERFLERVRERCRLSDELLEACDATECETHRAVRGPAGR